MPAKNELRKAHVPVTANWSVVCMLALVTAGMMCAQSVEPQTPGPTTTTTAASVTADPDLPQPFNPASLDAVVTSSPFTRSLNLSDSLVLTGIAFIEGKPVATVFNTEKKESYVISEEPNPQGWKLAETSATIQLDKTQVKLMIGSEIVTVRYSKEQIAPETMKPKVQQQQGGPPQDGRWRDRDRDRGDGDRPRFRPDPEMRRRFESLPDDARRKLFEEMRSNPERMQNLSQEERTAYMNRLLDRAERQQQQGQR